MVIKINFDANEKQYLAIKLALAVRLQNHFHCNMILFLLFIFMLPIQYKY